MFRWSVGRSPEGLCTCWEGESENNNDFVRSSFGRETTTKRRDDTAARTFSKLEFLKKKTGKLDTKTIQKMPDVVVVVVAMK